ncbi:MAG: hypothetical protein VB081_13845 [Christensenella sp.]|uniref:hypothetical protein n=1 Tax=Christensenella sp. TaxID=1935934 RepID=UPI002B20EE8D|nr:hypothetical protein [Christensenella sp.]MEA5004564.1 hypothetical protein [Christensenella sp.]
MSARKCEDIDLKLELASGILNSVINNHEVLKAYDAELTKVKNDPNPSNTRVNEFVAMKNLKLDRLPTITIMKNKIRILRRELLELSSLIDGD